MILILKGFNIVLVVFLFLCMMGVVYGGDNSTINHTYIINEEYNIDDFDKVYALEDGHFNTSFSDGFYGYCVEYGETEAVKGDVFLVGDTSYIRNSVTGNGCGDYLKVYFIDYYQDAQNDKIVTQHMIWHFTDDFNGWRLNYTLIDLIKDKVDNQGVHYSDSGYRVLSDNLTVMFWDFHSFLSEYIGHQDYFGYRIGFGDTDDIPVNDTLENNTDNNSNISNNSSVVNNTINTTFIGESNNITMDIISDYNPIVMDNYKNSRLYCTGFNIWAFACMIIMLIVIIFLDKRY